LGTVRGPLTINVDGPGDALAVAWEQAQPGDTIVLAPGVYPGPLVMKEGITVMSKQRHQAVLQGGVQVSVATGLVKGRLVGVHIEGGRTGLLLQDSAVEIDDVLISNAEGFGVEIHGGAPVLRASRITKNRGGGVLVADGARPVLVNNQITENGLTAGTLRPGVQIMDTAEPTMSGNVVKGNGAEPLWVSPLIATTELEKDNTFALPGKPKRGTKPVRVVTP
jgi:F-box protein 11